jgi:hypothetical protein
MLERNVPLGLGVDGSASNERSDLLHEVKQALLVARARGGPEAMTVREAFRLGTRGGAQILGRDDIGSLEAGKCADFAVWRLDELEFGGADDPLAAARAMAAEFGPGPVVLGPPVADLTGAARSAEEALAGLRAAAAWPQAPRPVWASDLLPERAIDGDSEARQILVERVYRSLEEVGGALLDTVAAYLESGGSLEATARALFVHTNTVRYRLRRAVEVTGYLPTSPRDAFALRVALALGRLASEEPAL